MLPSKYRFLMLFRSSVHLCKPQYQSARTGIGAQSSGPQLSEPRRVFGFFLVRVYPVNLEVSNDCFVPHSGPWRQVQRMSASRPACRRSHQMQVQNECPKRAGCRHRRLRQPTQSTKIRPCIAARQLRALIGHCATLIAKDNDSAFNSSQSRGRYKHDDRRLHPRTCIPDLSWRYY